MYSIRAVARGAAVRYGDANVQYQASSAGCYCAFVKWRDAPALSDGRDCPDVLDATIRARACDVIAMSE